VTEHLQPTFRPVEEGDREFLRALFFTSWDRAIAYVDCSHEEKQAILNQQFEAQDQSYLMQYPTASRELILLEGEPVGRIYVARGEGWIELMDITLLPAYRSRGLGTGILLGVCKEATATDKKVELYVEKWNPDARRLYLRLGFADQEDIGSHWKMVWVRGAGGGSQEKIDS